MTRPPLIATADEDLLDDLLRLTAAAGTTPELARDAGSALRGWGRAPAVLVGADLLPGLARMAPPRRDDVGVVTRGGGWAASDVLAVGAAWLAELPRDEAAVVAALGDLAEPSGTAPLVAVLGGSGGAGASVLATALALRAAGRGPALLVDLDPLGPGLERLAVCGSRDEAAPVGWSDLAAASGRLGGRALRDALPRSAEGAGVLGWSAEPAGRRPAPPSGSVVREALAAGVRGHVAVVVDLPRAALAPTGPDGPGGPDGPDGPDGPGGPGGPDGPGGSVVPEVLARADAVVLACVATLPGLAGAVRLLHAPHLAGTDPLVVLRGPLDARLGAAAVLGREPCAAEADQPGLDDDLALGLAPVRAGTRAARGRRGALARAADAVWSALLGAGVGPGVGPGTGSAAGDLPESRVAGRS